MKSNQASSQEYDIIIIGAGPAGISLANRLTAQTSGKILLVESGLHEVILEILELSGVKATGHFPEEYYPLHAQRLFGGTSNSWAGFCTTLEKRAFLNNEWVIDYADIEPYYKDAAEILELPPEAYQQPASKLTDEGVLIYKPYYKSPPVRFGEKYFSTLNEHPDVEIALGTTCTRILAQDQTVDGLVLQNSQGDQTTEYIVKADQYVLACGGIGNPRLLLLNNLANNSPVGNYFMEHPHIYAVGEVELRKDVIDAVIGSGNITHAIQLSDDFCLQNGLLNFAVAFNPANPEKRVFLGEQQELYISSTTIRGEMLPQKTNQVSLVESLDRLQQPSTNVHFDYNYQELALKSWDAFAKQLLALGIGRATVPPEFYPSIAGGGHFMGTTRMGSTEADSVVDSNCKVHVLENLYIAGSSIFPAGGAANPTYSIVAFSLRLADHLATKLNG